MYFAKGKNSDQKGYMLNISVHLTFWKGKTTGTENTSVVARGLKRNARSN